ncbi:hypothetical protein ACFW3Z_09110 [Nocardiopsis alba]|uniref:hypothetical protein n=1 Tax=Nocardiopsis alba TaxID=53437 RepID=UPI00339F6DD0
MESTPTLPADVAETARSLGAYVVRKRPLGALKGIGFMPLLWVRDALKAGLFSSTRAYTVASVIATAGDCDGRYCFLYLKGVVERSGGTMSLPTVKRAIGDLVEAGLVRKLDRRQVRAFFAEDLADGKRWGDRLPSVLELLIPASAYPEQTLKEINEVRDRLGEGPLDETTRPYPSVGTTAQVGEDDGSESTTDGCPGTRSLNKDPASVRDSVGTGEQSAPKRPDGPHRLISRIPNILLREPATDRERLGRAVDDLLRQGLGVGDVTALFNGMEGLRRPFPALMHRLRGLKAARAFLDGSLGRGVTGAGFFSPRWPTPDDDPFGRSPGFHLDSQGKADGTCPEHSGVRNVPGGNCALCGARCRSTPGELLHPVPAPAARPEPRSLPREKPDLMGEWLDPDLVERMTASLAGGGAPSTASAAPGGPKSSSGSGLSLRTRSTLDDLRALLNDSRRTAQDRMKDLERSFSWRLTEA